MTRKPLKGLNIFKILTKKTNIYTYYITKNLFL